mgnify:CR=1 FL=1
MDDSLNVPRHMRSPGDDGYRTPTIEDAERTLSDFGIEDSPGGQVLEVHSTALQEVLQRATSRVAEKSKKEGNKEATACFDHNGLGIAVRRKPPSRLGWKKRIRHVTWAYFTLTMATGGLANVFYQGMQDIHKTDTVCPPFANKQQSPSNLKACTRSESSSS